VVCLYSFITPGRWERIWRKISCLSMRHNGYQWQGLESDCHVESLLQTADHTTTLRSESWNHNMNNVKLLEYVPSIRKIVSFKGIKEELTFQHMNHQVKWLQGSTAIMGGISLGTLVDQSVFSFSRYNNPKIRHEGKDASFPRSVLKRHLSPIVAPL